MKTTRSQLVSKRRIFWIINSSMSSYCDLYFHNVHHHYHYHYCWMEGLHRNHLTSMKPCKSRDIFFHISTGEFARISEPSTVSIGRWHLPHLHCDVGSNPLASGVGNRRCNDHQMTRKKWRVVEMLKANPCSPFLWKKTLNSTNHGTPSN